MIHLKHHDGQSNCQETCARLHVYRRIHGRILDTAGKFKSFIDLRHFHYICRITSNRAFPGASTPFANAFPAHNMVFMTIRSTFAPIYSLAVETSNKLIGPRPPAQG